MICSFLPGCNEQKEAKQVLPNQNQIVVSDSAININTASAEELEKLPHVGKIIARKIVDYRETYGIFRKVEHLLLVGGISDDRFREIKSLVKVE